MPEYQTFPKSINCERHGPYSGSAACPSCMAELKANGVTF